MLFEYFYKVNIVCAIFKPILKDKLNIDSEEMTFLIEKQPYV